MSPIVSPNFSRKNVIILLIISFALLSLNTVVNLFILYPVTIPQLSFVDTSKFFLLILCTTSFQTLLTFMMMNVKLWLEYDAESIVLYFLCIQYRALSALMMVTYSTIHTLAYSQLFPPFLYPLNIYILYHMITNFALFFNIWHWKTIIKRQRYELL
jgi:hypothetical protein